MFILRDVFIQLHNQFVLVGKWDKQTFRSPRVCFMRRFQSSIICEEEYLCIQTNKNRFSVVIYTDFVAFGSNQGELKGLP